MKLLWSLTRRLFGCHASSFAPTLTHARLLRCVRCLALPFFSNLYLRLTNDVPAVLTFEVALMALSPFLNNPSN